MNGGSKIVGLHPDGDGSAGDDPFQLDDIMADLAVSGAATPEPEAPVAAPEPEPEPDTPTPSGPGAVIASLAIGVALAWLGGMLAFAWPSLSSGVAPLTLISLIGALASPLALIALFALLMLRTSQAEAKRFGATARAMRAEAAALERAIAVMSNTLEANRKELARQTTELLALGDRASERLSALSNAMAGEARQLEMSSALLTDTANEAEKSLSVVLASVPRAHEETAAMRDALEAAGLTAGERTAALAALLAELKERGREANEMAGGAAERLAAHIARMEATSETAGARLEAVTAEMSNAVDSVLDRAGQAVEQARRGITAQGEAMLAMVSTNQAAIEKAGAEGIAALGDRIAHVETSVERIAAKLGAQSEVANTLLTGLNHQIGSLDGRIQAVMKSGSEGSQTLAASMSALGETALALEQAMVAGNDQARQVIATAEEILTALDAAAREMDESMPEALNRLDLRIAQSRKVVAASKPELLALVTAAESTHDAIEAIAGVIATQRDTLAEMSQALLETLDTGRERIGGVQEVADSTIATTRRFAEESAPQLIEALVRIRETATVASEHARKTLGQVIPDAADRIEQEGASALARALDRTVNRQIEQLSVTAEAAVATAMRAAERLTQQMLAIGETSAMVESRIEAAREERENSDRDHFARRVSLLIEAMNSSSIDITKALSTDVTDSAWAAYLKGDRGVFTRRAVRLLDTGQAREIAGLYDADEDFRDQVNRYIHDFEAMLRQVLALRDGSPLGVTLLSSDMGKLYVVLAQAIERLRA